MNEHENVKHALDILHQALIETDRVEVLKHLNATITLLS